MAAINSNFLKLKAGYLFPEIARRVKAYSEANPEKATRIIRCGIGDVTEPLPPAVVKAMHEAVEQGVRFMACSDALRAQGLTLEALIPECRGHGGAVQYMARAVDRRWRTLVF